MGGFLITPESATTLRTASLAFFADVFVDLWSDVLTRTPSSSISVSILRSTPVLQPVLRLCATEIHVLTSGLVPRYETVYGTYISITVFRGSERACHNSGRLSFASDRLETPSCGSIDDDVQSTKLLRDRVLVVAGAGALLVHSAFIEAEGLHSWVALDEF